MIRRDEEQLRDGRFARRRTRAPRERIMHLLKACVPDYDWTFWIELWSLALRDERAARAPRGARPERFRDADRGDGPGRGRVGGVRRGGHAVGRDHDRDAHRRDGAPGDPRRHDHPPELHARRLRVASQERSSAQTLKLRSSRRIAMTEHRLPTVGWGDVVVRRRLGDPGAGNRERHARGSGRAARRSIRRRSPTGSQTPARF